MTTQRAYTQLMAPLLSGAGLDSNAFSHHHQTRRIGIQSGLALLWVTSRQLSVGASVESCSGLPRELCGPSLMYILLILTSVLASFSIISLTSLTQPSPQIHLYRAPAGPPILFVPDVDAGVRIIDVSKLRPAEAIPFSAATAFMDNPSRASGSNLVRLHDYSPPADPQAKQNPPPPLTAEIGWDLSIPDSAGEKAVCCTTGRDGTLVVVIGSRGSIWIYGARLAEPHDEGKRVM
jgi:hypothetical protein